MSPAVKKKLKSAVTLTRQLKGLMHSILTEWDEFRDLNYRKIYDRMMKPAFIFDGRNIANRKELIDIGFKVYAIGR